MVTWENLFPACLRCNREKRDYEGKIINPCIDRPQDYLALHSKCRYRFKGIDSAGTGKDTITAMKLNDTMRVMVPRMTEWEDIHKKMEEILEDLNEGGYKPRYKNRMGVLMSKCTKENSYAAVKATNMLDDDCYIEIKKFLIQEGQWTDKLKTFEDEMKQISLRLV